jgi:hypothetical protein
LARLERLETLRIVPSLVREMRLHTPIHQLAEFGLARMLAGVARFGVLRRLEMRGHDLRDLSPLTVLPQLEVLLIDDTASAPVTLPWPMPHLRALTIPREASPQWPSYPTLEQVALSGLARPSPDIAAHLIQCVTSTGGGGAGRRLRWLSLAGYWWVPVGTCARILEALLPALEVLEIGANVTRGIGIDNSRDPARWCVSAPHLAECLAAWTGHRMADMTTDDIERWSASGPAVATESLLDF